VLQSMTKTVAILQSNYIPWKGYFDLINAVDEFIVYDEMQYTKNDWRNRNRIKTKDGVQWLTIPVKQNQLSQTIRETEVVSNVWRRKHWNAISQAYSRSRYFKEFEESFRALYMDDTASFISEINYAFIKLVNTILGVNTKLSWSSDYEIAGNKTERLVNICTQAGADIYATGPSAFSYLDLDLFKKADIEIKTTDYSGYPEYEQRYPPFEHAVSILDLIFNMGTEAKRYMKSFSVDLYGNFLKAPFV
jgi:hypothetical protein